MKKLTIKEYADILRIQYPNKTKGKSDIQIVSSWISKYPEKVESLRLDQRALLSIEDAKKYTKQEFEKLKQKISPNKSTTPQPQPQPTDSTKTQDSSNWLQNVMGTINQIKSKNSSDTTKPTTQQPVPPQEKKVAPKFTSRFKTRKCDENTYPWTRGCVNNKIGQMNQAYFGDRYADTYGDELYMQLDSLGYFDAAGQKDGEITQYIYDGVMNDRRVDETKILGRKKIVKETVKNVLKQRFNKK